MTYKNSNTDINICIVGLGYVGYPLLKLFMQKYNCIGIDINTERVIEIKNSKEVRSYITSDWNDYIIDNCNVYIVAVPTPTNKNHQPETSALKNVCNSLGAKLKKGDLVIFESTVYPGATEELCVPILEKSSGLKLNSDFSVGYSPERINTGDKRHQIHNTPKIITASNSAALDIMYNLYGGVIDAPIVKASSLKAAEAAKMYENVQRDVLIALANQFSDYCRVEGIDVYEVTQCASTKWNFSNVKPGLVGGHCIGVDPYYLLERASTKGIHLPLVETARQINERKAEQVAQRLLEMGKAICGSKRVPYILLLGFSYKPNTNDIRNTKVADVVKRLQGKCNLDCYDPLVDTQIVRSSYGVSLCSKESIIDRHYDLSVMMVPHDVLSNLYIESTVHIDIKDLL